MNITISKNKYSSTIKCIISTPEEFLEYIFDRGLVRREDWRGWHPDVYGRVLNLLNVDNIGQTALDLRIRFDVLNPHKTAGVNNVEFWNRRGWTDEDAAIHIKQTQKSRNTQKQQTMTAEYWVTKGYSAEIAQQMADNCRYGSSIRRPEFWMKQGLSAESASIEISKFQKLQSPRAMEYWISRGCTVEQATNEVSKTQQKHAKVAQQKWINGEMDKSTRNTNFEYWVKKANGDIEKAKQLQRERQTTFSLSKCIEQYGQVHGTMVWEQRQDKWQTTMQSKSPDEIARINRARQSSGNGLGFGQVSQILFWNVYNHVKTLPYSIWFAELNHKTQQKTTIKRNHEYVLRCADNIYRPDFYIPELGILVEFDEKHHWGTTAAKINDTIRENNIKTAIKDVTFIRIKETEYADNPAQCVNKLVNAILAKHQQYQAELLID